MSASSKKKLRKAQNEELLTQRQMQEQKESKKLKLITTLFVSGLALILVAFIGITIFNTISNKGLVGKWTTVATIGEHKLSLTEFNYYYVDSANEIADLINNYSSEAEQYGSDAEEALKTAILMATGKEDLDITKPLTELIYDEETGKTWADHLTEEALSNAKRDYALYDAAMDAGFELSEEEKASLESIPDNLDNYASWTGYGSGLLFIRKAYGYGKYATIESYVEYLERSMIADAYYAKYSEDLTYKDQTLRDYEGDTPEDYNSYTYAYYTVNVDQFLEGGTTNEDGTVTYSAEEKEAARAKAEAAANDLTTADSLESFNDKIAHAFSPDLVDHTHDEEGNVIPLEEPTKDEDAAASEGDAATTEGDAAATEEDTKNEEELDEEHVEEETPETSIVSSDVIHTSAKTDFREWLAKAETVSGNATVIAIEKEVSEEAAAETTDAETAADEQATEEKKTEITGYYVVYLVKKSENKTAPVNVRHLLVQVEKGATEEDWAAAKTEAEKLLADWKAGETTEDTFHTLVHDNTDDTASAEDGGLYENVRETSGYVDNFLAWCIDPARTEGETGIIETEYGYHIMYFVSRNELSYRDQLISDELRVTDTETWQTNELAKYTVTEKNMKKIDKDIADLQY